MVEVEYFTLCTLVHHCRAQLVYRHWWFELFWYSWKFFSIHPLSYSWKVVPWIFWTTYQSLEMPGTKQGEGRSPLKTRALHTCLSGSPSPRPAGHARGALVEGQEPSRGFSQSEWDFPLSPRTELGESSLSYWLERPQWADTRSRRWSSPKLSATGPRPGSFQGLFEERSTKQRNGRMGD